MKAPTKQNLSRRGFIGLGLGSAASAIGAGVLAQSALAQTPPEPTPMAGMHHAGAGDVHASMSQMLVGTVDHARNGFDPMQMLVDWDHGTITGETDDGRPIREYDFSAGDVEIEIAPGIFFPAWTYNGRVPGPSIRCAEGDHLRVNFANYGSHPHTLHFHGFHPAEMDGVEGQYRGAIAPGRRSPMNSTLIRSAVIFITATRRPSNGIFTKACTARSSSIRPADAHLLASL